jgi:uncharacterized protein involved in exopolysaccharide biosynthesis
MAYSSSAPVRQPLPELPESDVPVTPDVSETQDGGASVLRSIGLLWESRVWLFRLALYSMVATTLIAVLVPSRYESVARLMPPDSQSSSGLAMAAAALGGSTGGLAGMAGDFLGLKSTSDVFVGILTSRTVQDKLVEEFELKNLYGLRRMEDTRRELSSRTAISVDRKSQIITIVVTDKNPRRAAAMTQAYVEELNHLVADLSTSSARRERLFLEERLKAVTRDLEAAERDFSQFASKNTAIDVKEQGRAMVEAAATLQGQLIATQSQYQGLREIYTDNSPRVRSVRARIDELRRQLEKLGGKGESETDASGASNDSMYPSIRRLPLLGVTYADLYRQTKIQETVLETLTKEYEVAKVQEAKEIPTVKVLDTANIPDKKSFPPRFLIISLGTLLATSFGVLFVLGSASWDAIDADDPGKRFAGKVWGDLKLSLPFRVADRSVLRYATHRFSRNWGRRSSIDTKI